MSSWPNPSIAKITTPNMGTIKGNRPKGLKDEEWNAIVSDERLNRQITLNCVPKASKKSFGKKED